MPSQPQTSSKQKKAKIPAEARVLFVGDRVSALVVIGIAISLLLEVGMQATSLLASTWIFYILTFVGFFCIIVLIATYEEFYWTTHMLFNSNILLSLGCWVGLTGMIIGICQPYFGLVHIVDVTLAFLAMYASGYLLAREIWRQWGNWTPLTRGVVVMIVIAAFLIPSFLVGVPLLLSGNIHVGTLVLTYGIGSLGAAGLKALMLHLFLDPSGLDVIEDPPAKLVFIGTIYTFLVDIIAWTLLVFMVPIPPLAGGGGGSKSSSRKKSASKSSSAQSHYHHHYWGYRHRRYVLAGPPVTPKVHDRAEVTACWEAVMGPHESLASETKSPVEDDAEEA